MLLKPCSASGYQNEGNVQAAWLKAFCAVGLHEIGKFTASTTGPSPAPGGAAAVPSARADDHADSPSGSATSAAAAQQLEKRRIENWPQTISLSRDRHLRHYVPP